MYRPTIYTWGFHRGTLLPGTPDEQGSEADLQGPNLAIDAVNLNENGASGYQFRAGSLFDSELRDIIGKHVPRYGPRKVFRSTSSPSDLVPPTDEQVLRLYFKEHHDMGRIAKMVSMPAEYVQHLIEKYRPLMAKLLFEVVAETPETYRVARHAYFKESFFTQLTNREIGKKYGVSHQAVSASILRTSKKIIQKLQEMAGKPVAKVITVEGSVSVSVPSKKIF